MSAICGYLQAGVEGRQLLPDEFRVARATGSETPQPVYVMRELDLDARQRADKVHFWVYIM